MLTLKKRSLLSLGWLALLGASLVILLGPTLALAKDEDEAQGQVYVLNNNLAGPNSITIFNRKEDGSLRLHSTLSIGGKGDLAAFSDGTQGSLILARDHEEGKVWLFAADLGSDQISVIRVNQRHLSLRGVFASGGVGPVSLTYRNGLLYVLNAANANSAVAANVTGFHVNANGSLTPIAGSTRPLSTAHPNPAQVQLDPSGRYLVVTEKATNRLDVYEVHHDGSLSNPTSFPSVGAYPFGMAFNPASPRQLVVADAAGVGPTKGLGAATSYRLVNGTIQAIGGPVEDHQIAPCWMVITHDGRFAYTSNADSYGISGYRIQPDGTLSLLNASGVTALTPSDTFPIEEALTHNSRFLYVLESRLLLAQPGPVTLGGFLIHHDGSLISVVDSSKIALPFSAIGLAAQ